MNAVNRIGTGADWERTSTEPGTLRQAAGAIPEEPVYAVILEDALDSEVARKVCGIVAGLIETDGGFNAAEHVFLRRVLKRFRLREKGDEAPVPPLDRPEAVKALSELSDPVRSEVLELLIEAAIVDGRVVPLEQRFLVEAARILGIDEPQLEARLVDRLLES